MPMVRIGEALIVAGHDQRRAARRSAGAAAARTAACRWASCWCAGRGLARRPAGGAGAQDGLPAGRPRRRSRPRPRRCASCRYAVALRLRLMPLLVRDGRLVVALDDPARRRAAVDEVEFSAQMKVVPVLAQCRSTRGHRCTAPTRRSAPPTGRSAARDDAPRPIDFELDRHRQAGRDAGAAKAPDRRRAPTTTADRAVRQLAGAPDQQHDRRGAQGRRLRHPHRELPGPREDPHPLPQGRRCCAPTSSCRRTTATR